MSLFRASITAPSQTRISNLPSKIGDIVTANLDIFGETFEWGKFIANIVVEHLKLNAAKREAKQKQESDRRAQQGREETQRQREEQIRKAAYKHGHAEGSKAKTDNQQAGPSQQDDGRRSGAHRSRMADNDGASEEQPQRRHSNVPQIPYNPKAPL